MTLQRMLQMPNAAGGGTTESPRHSGSGGPRGGGSQVTPTRTRRPSQPGLSPVEAPTDLQDHSEMLYRVTRESSDSFSPTSGLTPDRPSASPRLSLHQSLGHDRLQHPSSSSTGTPASTAGPRPFKSPSLAIPTTSVNYQVGRLNRSLRVL